MVKIMFIYTCKKSPKFQKSWFSIIQIISKSIADIDIDITIPFKV